MWLISRARNEDALDKQWSCNEDQIYSICSTEMQTERSDTVANNNSSIPVGELAEALVQVYWASNCYSLVVECIPSGEITAFVQ